jgi:hypothetical protein
LVHQEECGESIEILACARDLQSRADPENLSGGANRQESGKTYPGTILPSPRIIA